MVSSEGSGCFAANPRNYTLEETAVGQLSASFCIAASDGISAFSELIQLCKCGGERDCGNRVPFSLISERGKIPDW